MVGSQVEGDSPHICSVGGAVFGLSCVCICEYACNQKESSVESERSGSFLYSCCVWKSRLLRSVELS